MVVEVILIDDKDYSVQIQHEYETQLRSHLLRPRVDLLELRSMSRQPGGFQTNALRRLIWPKLLGVNRFSDDIVDPKAFIVKHRDDYQVWCDVTRLWGCLHPITHTSDHYQGQRR